MCIRDREYNMKYFLMLLVLSTLFIVGCDDRGYENPTMDVTFESDYGNIVYNKTGFNEIMFKFQLDGPLSKIVDQRINVNLVNNMGNFIGTGSNLSMLTNEFGYAEGRFIAGNGYGTANIEFSFCLLYTSPSPRDLSTSRMPSSA
eukprot:TRINITY_DN36624_c0_g1_i3.p2 TRINITY_DN36624_c0_g1~~TRINITY_DN36624_c0_g1_i3.p2  ORF type:complete len:145 (+),score=21.17 TRINITY_DN36624_c0_g1_i3:103-537(+)